MNYMKQIAEMLGVEMGEEFKVRSTKCIQNVNSEIFVFTKVGMTTDDGITRNDILIDLLLGAFEIVKLPWKPKDGDYYWYHEYDEGCALCRTTWSDSSYDLALYKLGKLYRTKAEAEKHADEDAAYWESIRKELEE